MKFRGPKAHPNRVEKPRLLFALCSRFIRLGGFFREVSRAERPSQQARSPVLLMGGAAADELVTFQGGGDLKVGAVVIRASTNPVRAQDLPHATQADGLRAFPIQ